MPIMLTTPKIHHESGLPMPFAMADDIRISPLHKVAGYDMWWGNITGGAFLPMFRVNRYTYRDTPAEEGAPVENPDYDPEQPITEGNMPVLVNIIPAGTDFSDLVSKAIHIINGSEQVGDVIAAYDLISENAIYAHEIVTRPELYGGTIL